MKMRRKKKGSKPATGHAFHVFIFAVSCFYCLELEEGEGGREGLRGEEGSGEKEVTRKLCAVSHTGGEAEPLGRILLVMSAIWNVESLPLSVTVLERGCLKPLCRLPPACQRPGGTPEATPVRTRGY